MTFTYGTAGRVSLSPDPAFIPAGQLAADVVIRGLAAGNTTITPSAIGVSGAAATVSVAGAILNIPYTSLRIGAGQFEAYPYVAVPNAVPNPLTVSLSSTNPAVATAPSSITIPATGYSASFRVSAIAPGSASIIATALGWTPDTLLVTATTPMVTIGSCCSTNLTTTTLAQNVYISSTDDMRYRHWRSSSLAVRVTSSDANVVRVLDTLVTIGAGTYYSAAGRIIPGGIGGTAWIKSSASGHIADSVLYSVSGPALTMSPGTSYVGLGQVIASQYVNIPNPIASPLVVTLANSDTTKGATNPTVTIPAGYTYASIEVRGRGVGTSTITASASGYASVSATNVVTTPKLQAFAGSLVAFGTSNTNVYVEDSLGSWHNRLSSLTLTLRSSDTTKLKIDPQVVIPAGNFYVPTGINITAVDTGTVKIYASAPGHATDSATWTITPARLTLGVRSYEIGARQHQLANAFYLYTSSSRTVPVTVTLTQKQPSKVGLTTTSIIVPAGQSYAYYSLGGLVPGRDTIIASAPGYIPDTAFVTVTSPRLGIYYYGDLPATATTTNPPSSITLQPFDSSGTSHYASDTIVVHAVSSNPTVIRPTLDYFRILKDANQVYASVQYVGAGTATITYSDSTTSGYLPVTTRAVTVTGPSLAISGYSPVLGTGQNTGVNGNYVYAPNAVGIPLVVHLSSTGTRVATVRDSVIIPAGSNGAYFTISAGDTIGTVQIQATANGYASTSLNVQVTIPKFTLSISTQLRTTSPASTFNVYARDANGSVHAVNQNLVVALSSLAPGVATIDSATVTILAGQYSSNAAKWGPVSVGSAQLVASDPRVLRYPYTSATASVTVVTPATSLSISSQSLGIGQYQDHNVSIPDAVNSGVTVPLNHSAVPSTSTPASVVVVAGSYSANFRVTGTSAGTDTITASPSGYISATGIVTTGLGRIDPLSGWPSTLRAGDSTRVSLYTLNPAGDSWQYVAAATTFTFTPNANLQFVADGATSGVITSITVPAGGNYATFWVKGVNAGTTGSATITSPNYITYTNSVSVTP